jgi:cathepsin D
VANPSTRQQPGLYKPAASTSSTTNGQKFRVAYGDGTMATGTVYRETVTIGGLKVKNQAVGAADQSTLDDTSSNGISGFGFPSIAQFKADPVWVTLYKQGKLGSKAQFAFGLSRTKARLDLGGVDKASYSGSLVYSKVDSSSGFWQTPGTLNGKAINAVSSSGGAEPDLPLTCLLLQIIDTGTTVVVGPVRVLAGPWLRSCTHTLPVLDSRPMCSRSASLPAARPSSRPRARRCRCCAATRPSTARR